MNTAMIIPLFPLILAATQPAPAVELNGIDQQLLNSPHVQTYADTNRGVYWAPAPSARKVIGLVHVHKLKRTKKFQVFAPKAFEYKLENVKQTALYPKKIKHIPDLRTREERHPIVKRVRDESEFYGPILNVIGNTVRLFF